jgi:hypothetical protein
VSVALATLLAVSVAFEWLAGFSLLRWRILVIPPCKCLAQSVPFWAIREVWNEKGYSSLLVDK